MKKVTVAVLFAIVMQISASIVHAQQPYRLNIQKDDSLQRVVSDSLYGALAGALIGVATLAFVDEPKDKTDNIRVGAGTGLILGSIYGTMKVSRSFANLEDGKMTVQFPEIQIDPYALVDGNTFWKANLLHISY